MHAMRRMTVICLVSAVAFACAAAANAPVPVSVLYLGDVYQPYCDPDDHWDLATVYALAKARKINLLGIVLDHTLAPDPHGFVIWGAGDPAVQAVAMMNHVSGLAVPVAVGSRVSYKEVSAGSVALDGPDAGGVDLILGALRASPDPVAVMVVGSCRNLALAAHKDPALFKEKCRGVYLNADTVQPRADQPWHLEWNRSLDPEAYLSIWTLPCPVYWLPCFDDPSRYEVSRHGSFWLLRQGDILPHLSAPVQNYMLYALTRNTNQNWLSHLLGGEDQVALETHGAHHRNMWCTAGFLHAAGLTVTRDGQLAALDETPAKEQLFAFEKMRAGMPDADGADRWDQSPPGAERLIIEIRDTETYSRHMTAVLRELLKGL